MALTRSILCRSLDGVYAVVRFVGSMERRAADEARSFQARHDDGAAAAFQANSLHRSDQFLRSCLRRWPFWTGGHVELAGVSLQRDDIASAYAAASAALKLTPTGRLAERARVSLARAYLRRGEVRRAREIFEAAVSVNPNDAALSEDLAACYIAEESFEAAEKVFTACGVERLSGEGRAALAFVRSKLKDSTSSER